MAVFFLCTTNHILYSKSLNQELLKEIYTKDHGLRVFRLIGAGIGWMNVVQQLDGSSSVNCWTKRTDAAWSRRTILGQCTVLSLRAGCSIIIGIWEFYKQINTIKAGGLTSSNMWEEPQEVNSNMLQHNQNRLVLQTLMVIRQVQTINDGASPHQS